MSIFKKLNHFFPRKIFLLFTAVVIAAVAIFVRHHFFEKVDVLSSRYGAQIYISGTNEGYSSGGMVSLSSTQEPSVTIGGYQVSGNIQVDLYKTTDDALLDYLTHDKDGKQTKATPDGSKIQFVTTIKGDPITSDGTKVLLPLSETGIWYLKVSVGGKSADAFVVRSSNAAVVKEGNNEYVFWGQNFKTKKSIDDGVVILYNLQDSRKELARVSFSKEGIAKATLTAEADIAMVAVGDDRSIIPINLKYLNTGYSYKTFAPKNSVTRYFIYTDRPIYKPGDTVYFKAVLRDDDDARYTVPGGSARVKIFAGYAGSETPLVEKSYPISADGTVSGEYKLSDTAKVGYYSISFTTATQDNERTGSRFGYYDDYASAYIGFDVEYYKKPEFFLDVHASQKELIAKDDASFTINGQYFSGQPLVGQKIKYTVHSSDFYEYTYLSDRIQYEQYDASNYWYRSWWGETVTQGTETLNQQGEATISLPANIPAENLGKNQVFSIEATLDDGSQTPAFSRQNIIVYAGEYSIYRRDYTYGSKVNTTFSMPVALVKNRANADISGVELTAKIKRQSWEERQNSNKKYPDYVLKEEDVPSISATTDSSGNGTFSFTPSKTGSYILTVQGKDSRGNVIKKEFYVYVTAEDEPIYVKGGNALLTLSMDKTQYRPGDTAHVSVFSNIPDRDVLVSLERGRMDRFIIVHTKGKTGSVDIPIQSSDMPNMYASLSSFSDDQLDTQSQKIPVSTESKKILVQVTPDSKTYGPGETVTLNVSTTDPAGNPVAAELGVWAVDKAIFQLADTTLGDIFDAYWHERYDSTQTAHSLEGIWVLRAEGGGCFAKGTQVLMSDGTAKNIEDVRVGDYILTRSEKSTQLVKARVTATHSAKQLGYIILNGSLKVTANHIMRVNDTWKEAGSIQAGDLLVNESGKQVGVSSVEWQRADVDVYNLEIEKYHTYFANGIWVHNQKGAPRQSFKDTVYWNPAVHTDSSGRVQVRFTLPDNLTTWTIAAVAANAATQVGQTTTDIVVTKDVIVRPIIPNILRVGDEVYLSALVHNYTPNDGIFETNLTFDSGTVEAEQEKNVAVKSNETQQIYWRVHPNKQNDTAKLTFSAVSTTNKDATDTIVQQIPVRSFGFFESYAQAGEGDKSYTVLFDTDAQNDKSSVTVSVAATVTGSLTSAMRYLVDYPYGCVEQTTSRFVPAVIAKANQTMFKDALKDKKIDDIIKKGISKLDSQQKGDGGWTWWYSGDSERYITAYVVEYLLEAQKQGYEVNKDMLTAAKDYLERDYNWNNTPVAYEEEIARNYGLTLLGSDKKKPITFYNNLLPDVLSLAVMSNYLQGNKDPNSNGLNVLLSQAKTQGDGVYWYGGSSERFGSIDASTALAIRAILLAGGDRNIAAKAVRYLTRMRMYDYWSNTYATAQVVRALTEFAKTGNELTPNYSYTVSVDNAQIARGTITDPYKVVDVVIPRQKIQNGSEVKVTKKGDGQLYSSIVTKQWHTDTKAKAKDNGLSVTKEFVNEKGAQYSLAVGDTAVVHISVSGLKTDELYGVISDELPSGLVPVNERLNNEQYGQTPQNYYSSYGVSDKEFTENGVVMSVYRLGSGDRLYTYKARVVSEGTFSVPPTTASLMYAPEVYGWSDAQTLTITKESHIIPGKLLTKSNRNIAALIAILALPLVLVGFVVAKHNNVTMQSVRQFAQSLFKKGTVSPPDTPKQ